MRSKLRQPPRSVLRQQRCVQFIEIAVEDRGQWELAVDAVIMEFD